MSVENSVLKSRSKVIVAAGGIVWRHNSPAPELAVIHRARYGDWCLPKGKLKDRETWEETAIREVWEETGCKCRITGLAGVSHYNVGDKAKIVSYFNMAPDGECAFHPSEEVDQARWMKVRDALCILDYEEERRILSKMEPKLSAAKPKRRKWFINSLKRDRLTNSLTVYEPELDCRIRRSMSMSNKEPSWIKTARQFIEAAKEAIERNDSDEGWKCLMGAWRAEIFGYDASELSAQTKKLRREAGKLSSWRRDAVYDLIGKPEDPISNLKGSINPYMIYLATFVRDEAYNNQAYKINQRRKSLKIIFAVICLALVFVPLLSFTLGIHLGIGEWQTMLLAEFFGSLGAAFSVARTLTKKTLDEKIPEQEIGSFVTWMRPAIGAASGLASFVLLRAGVLDVAIKPELLVSPSFILAVAFASGFSERLIIQAIEKLQGSDKSHNYQK